MKTNSQQSFLFRFKIQFKAVSSTYTVQVVFNDSLHVPIKRNHNCSSNQHPWLPDASEKSNQRSQTGKHSSLWPFLLTTCCQPTVSTPSSTVPSVPWRFLSLSLSALQYLQCQANDNASGSNLKVTSQCKRPSSSTVPAHYWTSGVQLFTHYITNVATKPRSLTKQTRPSRLSCQRFSNLWQLNQGHWPFRVLMPIFLTSVWQLNQGHRPFRVLMPIFLNSVWQLNQGHRPFRVLMPIFLSTTVTSRHDARLSSTTHCALRASRINYNLTNLSRCYSFLFSNMDLCSTLPSSPFPFVTLSNAF